MSDLSGSKVCSCLSSASPMGMAKCSLEMDPHRLSRTIPWQDVFNHHGCPLKMAGVIVMPSTTSQTTIETLRILFSHYGLPEQVVLDNGPQFTSDEFAQFMQGNGIKHILCVPYHPASNGLAERFVQTFKRAMKAGEKVGSSLNHSLTRFLLRDRSTPHSTTNVAPSELFLKCNLRTLFDLLKPGIETRVLSKQADQKGYHDKRAKPHYFSPNQPVMVQDFCLNTDKWIPGTVVESLGSITYKVQVEGGNILKHHINHMLE